MIRVALSHFHQGIQGFHHFREICVTMALGSNVESSRLTMCQTDPLLTQGSPLVSASRRMARFRISAAGSAGGKGGAGGTNVWLGKRLGDVILNQVLVYLNSWQLFAQCGWCSCACRRRSGSCQQP